MSTVYITQQGATISKTSERLNVTLKKELLAEIPLLKVSEIVIFGRVTVTPPALRELMKRGIAICYLTQQGGYVGRTQPELSKNSLLRIEQFRAFFNDERRLGLARGFVLGKLANLRMMLIRKGGKGQEVKTAIERIKSAEKSAQKTSSLNMLRGHEGDASAAYFGAFQHLLKDGPSGKGRDWVFPKRVRRPPTDPVNALLSFGYTLLMNDIYSAVNIVGFDPYIGYLHAEKYGRPSLPLDLMEECRPLIVDAMVIACLNKRILTRDHFKQEGEGKSCRLTDEGRRNFLQQYEARRKTEFTHAVLKQKMTYQQAFEQQARLLAKVLQDERDDYPPLAMK